MRYIEGSHRSIDNNRVENAIRSFAIAGKNWSDGPHQLVKATDRDVACLTIDPFKDEIPRLAARRRPLSDQPPEHGMPRLPRLEYR